MIIDLKLMIVVDLLINTRINYQFIDPLNKYWLLDAIIIC
jgi:hypothetical protein